MSGILGQVLSALHEAHQAGLIHRDIKPANIRVVEGPGDGRVPVVKLLDFGFARGTDSGSPSVTKTGELLGTPRYMSPEQLTSQPLGPASDIYSLGVVGFELLAGHESMHGGGLFDQFDRMRPDHMFTIPQLDAEGARLVRVLQRMTELRPDARFPSAAAVKVALQEPAPTATHHAVEVTTRRKRAPLPIAALAAVAVVAAVGLAAAVTKVAGKNSTADEVETHRPEHPDPSSLLRSTVPTQPVAGPTDRMEDVGPDIGSDVADASRTHVAPQDAVPSAGCGVVPPFEGAGELAGVLTYLPRDYDPDYPHPLILLLHSDSYGPQDLLGQSRFRALADSERFVVALPTNPRVPMLNIPQGSWRQHEASMEPVRTAKDRASNELCVDESRIFVVMNGDSGRMSRHTPCEPWVRAMAVNSFVPDPNLTFGCQKPKPALWIVPTESKHVPHDGRPTCPGNDKKATMTDVEANWKKRNQCRGEPIDGADRLCQRWKCETPLQICLIPGGEGWQRPVFTTQPCAEPPPAEFDRELVLWEFFKGV